MRNLIALLACSIVYQSMIAQVTTFQTIYNIASMPAYSARSNVITTADGGFLMTVVASEDSSKELHLVKTYADGNIEWAKRLEANIYPQSLYFNSFVTELSDGGFAIEALLRPVNPGNDPSSIVVIRTDAGANVLWERTYIGNFANCSSILAANNGGIIVTGTIDLNGFTYDFWAAHLDATGNGIWAKSYDLGGNEIAASACYAANGDIIIGGTSNADMAVLRCAENGNVLWGNKYHGYIDDYIIEMKQLMNGDFICTGRAANPLPNTGCWDITLLRLTPNGNVLWSWFYGGNQCDEGYSVVENNDGTLVVACEPESFIGMPQSALMKTDPDGNFIWMKTYNDVNGTFPTSLTTTTDGGYAMMGTYGIFSPGDTPLFLNKTNENGVVNCGTQAVFIQQSPYALTTSSGVTAAASDPPVNASHTWTTEGISATVICERGPVLETVTAPNVFTPNDDGTNDIFIISYLGGPDFHLYIYDRWGVLMFESTDPLNHWNGNARNGEPATNGTYYYLVETELNFYNGFFTLLR